MQNNPIKHFLSKLDVVHLDGVALSDDLSLAETVAVSGSFQLPKLDIDQKLYEDPYKKIYLIRAQFGHLEKKYYVTDCGCRAGVVLIKDDNILLTRQYRLLINGMSWELPGGMVEEGETPKESALRECLEEAGVLCNSLHGLTGYYPGMDTFCNPTYLYYCDDFEVNEKKFQANSETIERAWIPLDLAINMICSMQIVDAFTIIGIFSCLYKNKFK